MTEAAALRREVQRLAETEARLAGLRARVAAAMKEEGP